MSNDNLNIDRIVSLLKEKEQGLTEAEAKEQSKLRKKYCSKHLEKGLNNKLRVQR